MYYLNFVISCIYHNIGHDIYDCCIHGLKKGKRRSFWGCLQQLKQLTSDPIILRTLKIVKDTTAIQTPDGRIYAWIRVALNLRVLDQALALIINQKNNKNLSDYFDFDALSRCPEGSQIWLSMLAALNGVTFNFKYKF